MRPQNGQESPRAIGTGADGALPVMTEVHQEARHRGVDLVVLPTPQAIGVLTSITKQTNASGTASRNAVM